MQKEATFRGIFFSLVQKLDLLFGIYSSNNYFVTKEHISFSLIHIISSK